MALNVSLFPSVTHVVPELRIGLSWAQLCSTLGPPRPYLEKASAPMFAPAEWLPGKTKGKSGVAAVHFGVLDLDHWHPDAIAGLIGALYGKGVGYYLASTWSNGAAGPEDCCARLLLPFSRPVLASEWPAFWGALNVEYAGGKADPKCKDIGRGYFFPSFPEGGNVHPFHDERTDGNSVPVDDLMARVGGSALAAYEDDSDEGASDTAASGGTDITRDQLRSLGLRLRGSSNVNRAETGRLLLLVLKGEPYAVSPNTPNPSTLPEGRNDTTFKLVGTICDNYPHAAPDKLSAHFRESVSKMGGEPTEEQIEDMVRRFQSSARAAHAALIEDAFGTGSGRRDPYTPSELQVFADRLEISMAQLRRRLVIQHGTTYYVFCNGDYTGYSEKEVPSAASRKLSPALTANVDTQKITPLGVRPKGAQELVMDYGIVAEGVYVDLTAQHGYYDEYSRKMIEAPCKIRVQAKYHEDVAQWLAVFAGPKHEKLLQWISVVTALREPCAALYLEGDPGTGKSLLALGLSKIWVDAEKGPTMLGELMGNFNESIVHCPLVFGDETAPVDTKGNVRTAELRELIQARTRPLTRKYKPNATIVGCIRVIMAANNTNLLQTSEHLTDADIQAIVDRIFYLPVQPSAAPYLSSLPHGVTKSWVDDRRIAEHAVWLSQNIAVPRTSRFLVAGETSELTRTLAIGTGLRARIGYWCISYLLDPDKLLQHPSVINLVRVSNGRLLVSSRAVVESWETYVKKDKDGTPQPMAVAKALSGLSSEITLRVTLPNGEKMNQKYRHVRPDLLLEWAQKTGYADKERLEMALKKIEEKQGRATPDRSLS